MNISILGATGSIGDYTLDVIRHHPDKYQVFALAANKNVDKMLELIQAFRPKLVVMTDEAAARELQRQTKTEVLSGIEGLVAICEHPDVNIVMAAIVGAAGLIPTLAAARAGKRICLANKEALVMAGDLFMREVIKNGAELLPVDSEHNAIFQSMPNGFLAGQNVEHSVNKIILTASGGPFRHTPLENFASITPAQAVAHPNWSMGKKISVDSATMMNKALEVIEAYWLFNMPAHKIEVIIHPESIIHSMVEYHDKSVLAQMGNPDMRTPIAHTLAWPQRISTNVRALNLIEVGQLNFYPADSQRFPCLSFAYEALKSSATLPAVINAANEVAVEAFLEGKIRFTDIVRVIEATVEKTECSKAVDLEAILQLDFDSRRIAKEFSQSSTINVYS